MGIRDQEITRIEKYAAGLGIKVTWVRHKKRGDNTGAEWTTDGSEIYMYIWPGKTKTQIVLDFVHELAHHMAWLADGRKITNKVEAAFGEMCNDTKHNPASKDARRIVYEIEKADAAYRDKVWDELGIQIPRWKMEVDRKLDIWFYKYYWRTGKDPIRKVCRKKRKEFNKLFKP
jgi:hypothetical protein